MDSWVTQVLNGVLLLVPPMLVWMIGVILGIAWWPRHPRTSLLLVVALGLNILLAAGGLFLIAWLPEYLRTSLRWERAQIVTASYTIAMIRSVASSTLWALILLAVFSGRTAAQQASTPRKWRAPVPLGASNSPADKNLLFGILALQMNFISQEDLITATNTWVRGKARPLDRILLNMQMLDEDEHLLLVGLVEKHLQRHNNDPRQSLATVSLVGVVRQQLSSLADPALESTLTYVAAARQDGDSDSARFATLGNSTASGERFRILRLHARGGLGEVFLASDQELHREVALKQIQEHHADLPDSRARFVQEALITGGLEHPGIVPVYGLGHYADGRPFYAMRFIRGDSLKEAIDRFQNSPAADTDPAERALQLRRLLGRFIDACNAVEYAHSRGVLHRDLKPGNVMLGKYGETLVVDWGLAKSVGKEGTQSNSEEPTLRPGAVSGSSQTLVGAAVGTPPYMSPEQASGRLDLLGPASDVYSLGATLYYLLTGKAPFTDSDLATVLRKVEQGDFPAPREVRRSVPAPLQAVCLKAMATDRDDRYASPTDLAEEIENWLADEPVSAHRDAWSVRVARTIRRHPLLTTATLAGLFGAILSLGLVFSILVPLQMQAQVKQLKEQASMYQAPTGEVSGELADLTRFVFAAGSASKTGSVGEKLRAFQQAIAVQERLVAKLPDVPQLKFDLADYYDQAARFASSTGSYGEAKNLYSLAITQRTDLTELFPKVPSLKDRLAATSAAMAWLMSTCPDPAIRDGVKAVHLAKKACELKRPDDPVYLDTLAASYARLGDFTQAITIGERALATAPQDLRARLSARLSLYKEGKAYSETESEFPSKVHP